MRWSNGIGFVVLETYQYFNWHKQKSKTTFHNSDWQLNPRYPTEPSISNRQYFFIVFYAFNFIIHYCLLYLKISFHCFKSLYAFYNYSYSKFNSNFFILFSECFLNQLKAEVSTSFYLDYKRQHKALIIVIIPVIEKGFKFDSQTNYQTTDFEVNNR